MNNGWAKVKQAAQYAGVSARTLRSWLGAGLRHSRLPSGTVLIRFQWIDEYLQQFETGHDDQIDSIVGDVLKDF